MDESRARAIVFCIGEAIQKTTASGSNILQMSDVVRETSGFIIPPTEKEIDEVLKNKSLTGYLNLKPIGVILSDICPAWRIF